MPHENPDHRLARAAGKATRSFLDGQRQDAERARAARQERAEAEARLEREERRRRQARADVGGSVLLRTARWWWGAVTALFLLLATAFLVAGLTGRTDVVPETPLDGAAGQYVLAGLTGVLTVATGIGAVQLMRGRRSAAGLLTGVAVIVGIPLVVRGNPALIAIAAVLLAGAALLWLPPVRRRLRAS
ncbi:hypothetical protein [Micrococcus sp. TA1]|uniref:hypothetical protein n=1 Tax=Micrococcus sp. TA1 TaxID=681627 RepID=UPI001609BBFB|nr:hypothetical protein [Micrococcus sp. TA1]MBB5749717.1 hypothetical protein [Micrococcus sp. TA1]